MKPGNRTTVTVLIPAERILEDESRIFFTISLSVQKGIFLFMKEE